MINYISRNIWKLAYYFKVWEFMIIPCLSDNKLLISPSELNYLKQRFLFLFCITIGVKILSEFRIQKASVLEKKDSSQQIYVLLNHSYTTSVYMEPIQCATLHKFHHCILSIHNHISIFLLIMIVIFLEGTYTEQQMETFV